MAWLLLCPLENQIQIQTANIGLNFGNFEVFFYMKNKERTKKGQYSYMCVYITILYGSVIACCLHDRSVEVAIF